MRAIDNDNKHQLTQAVTNFILNTTSDVDIGLEFTFELLKHNPYRIGALTLHTRFVEFKLRHLLVSQGLPLARLAQLFMGEGDRFSVLDAGATKSEMSQEYRAWRKDRWRVYGFDPSEAAILGESDDNIIIYPIGLGARKGSVTFYEMSSAGASSIFPAEGEFAERILNGQTRLSDSLTTVKTHEVEVIDVDNWRGENEIAPIDYMKINTQGSELEILKGSENTLQTCFGVQLEAAFAGHYKNAPKFWEIDRFLTDRGFTLFDIRKPTSFRRVRDRKNKASNVGPRIADFAWPSSQVFEAHLLYLRDPTHPSESQNSIWDELRSWLMLGVIAEMHGQFDFAIQLLEIVLNERTDMLEQRVDEFTRHVDAIFNTYTEIEKRHF